MTEQKVLCFHLSKSPFESIPQARVHDLTLRLYLSCTACVLYSRQNTTEKPSEFGFFSSSYLFANPRAEETEGLSAEVYLPSRGMRMVHLLIFFITFKMRDFLVRIWASVFQRSFYRFLVSLYLWFAFEGYTNQEICYWALFSPLTIISGFSQCFHLRKLDLAKISLNWLSET